MEFESQSQKSEDDIFDYSVKLEETHFQVGFKEGFKDGLVSGKKEAKEVGLKVGFEIGEELGFYQGCVDVWNSALRINPSCFSSRVQNNIRQVNELLKKYPLLEPEHVSVQAIMDGLRSKFKAITASLSVKLEYNGYSKAAEANNIDF